MTDWAELWGDSDEDDEDYDPLKDETVKAALEEDESGSDSFEGTLSILNHFSPTMNEPRCPGLRHILSPKKRKATHRTSTGDNGTPVDDVIGRRTRTHVQIPDEILKEAESQLERSFSKMINSFKSHR